jgi:uncharacterized repeat protein (TIGR03803 family)
MNSSNFKRMAFVAVVFVSLLGTTVVRGATMTRLHSFSGAPNDSSHFLRASLTLYNSTLYGTSSYGGSDNKGTIFQLNTDGSNYRIRHSFTGSAEPNSNPDGMFAEGGLTVGGSKLYGMTYFGGLNGSGCIYSIDPNGNDFNVIHSIDGTKEGGGIYDELTFSGSTLYGTTYGSAIFKLDADGSNFSYVRPFPSNCRGPLGGMTLGGSTLYGMCYWSEGVTYGGGIYKINTDLTGFEIIHHFTGGANDGLGPGSNALTLSGSTLYGVTESGGSSNWGTIFKVNVDGSGFEVLHSFDSSSTPTGDLTLIGSTLYGIGRNTIYQIDTNGDNYGVLHTFDVNDPVGFGPRGGLIHDGSTLYGLTNSGSQYGMGAIFALQVPEPSAIMLLGMGVFGLLAWGRRRFYKAV